MTTHCSLGELIRYVERKPTALSSNHLASCDRCRMAASLLAGDIASMNTKGISKLFLKYREEHLTIICRNGFFHSENNIGFSVLAPLAARGKKTPPSFVSSHVSIIPFGKHITIIVPSIMEECVLFYEKSLVEQISGKRSDLIFSNLAAGSYTLWVDGKKTVIAFTIIKKETAKKTFRKRS